MTSRPDAPIAQAAARTAATGCPLLHSAEPASLPVVEPDPRSLPHPPGPPNINRWIGLTWRHGLEFWLSPLGYVTKLAHRYGDLCSFLMFTQRAYVVNHPDLIHEYLVRRRDDYVRAPWEMRVLRQLVGDGILASEGDLWARQRRLVQQAFRGALVPRYADVTVEATRERVGSWKDGEVIDLVESMTALMMDVSIRTTTGVNPAELGDPTPEALSAAVIEGADQMSREMGIPVKAPDWLPLPSDKRKRRAAAAIDAYVRRAIAIRRANPDAHHDLLAVLLRAVDDEGDGRGMSDQQARDEVATILVASAHSTSSTLGWFWKLVLARPEVHERLVEEVDLVLGGREPTACDVPNLRYVTQTLKETMRLSPAAYVLFARMPIRDTSLGGYRVRRGGWVMTFPWVTHRDPRFFPDPLRFDPERFSPGREREIPKGAYFPFGHGPRVCIGQNLAMTQLPLVVAKVLQTTELEPQPGFDELSIRRELAIRPATPCAVRVRLRGAPPPRKPR
jgi:cytochrome P450